MTLTKRGESLKFLFILIGAILVMGFVGWMETQTPTNTNASAECKDMHNAAMILENHPARWVVIEKSWEIGCPFQDNNGNYLYQWDAQ